MLKWDSVFDWGRRASDRPLPAPAVTVRDRALEGVIADGQVEVHYQPVIEPRTGRIVGAEALARAAIEPTAGALFARAAKAKLDERLSRHVQQTALRRAASWDGALSGMTLAINLLPADICCGGYDDWLIEEMESAGIDPGRVVIEITETALLPNPEVVAERLLRLREAGVRIAIDDFGTGYASLSYLTRLPIDILKIDGELIANLANGERDRIVVRALIDLARELELTVLVEGVESTEQLALLCEWGCDLYQGFLSAGALTEEELARFVATANAEAA
jgi:EAL domain-containing protein (putative c-di-GMP-specific phosphodiesterase class I)